MTTVLVDMLCYVAFFHEQHGCGKLEHVMRFLEVTTSGLFAIISVFLGKSWIGTIVIHCSSGEKKINC
jgi:hypothetical protein